MIRKFLLGLVLSLLTVVAFQAKPAAGRELVLTPVLCVGGADSASAALALEKSMLDCGDNRFAKRDRFVRTHADIGADYNPADERLFWQTDPSSFDSMLVRFSYDDGTTRLVDVDPQMAARNWFVQTRFTVPVPSVDARLSAIDMIVERPRTLQTVRDARLVGRTEAREEHDFFSLIYAFLCGLLLVPIIYDLLFFRLLRYRFMIWHSVMTFGILAFVVSNTGLIFRLFPQAPLGLRFQLNTLALAVATCAAVFFVRSMLEERTISRPIARMAIGFTALMLVMKCVSMVDLEQLRIVSHSAFLLSILPLALALIALIATALLAGSRAAIYLLIAFSGMVIGGVIRLLMALGWYDPSFHIDDFLYFAMAILVLGTSAAVGDRFMVLRVERDRARVSAIKLGRMAMTDPLTGLGNRRAFQSIRRIENGQALLVADIDHFKLINDSKGHGVGDAVLCHMASLMRDSFDTIPGSTIYRLGGEEFAVVFECPDRQSMKNAAERLRKAVDRNVGSGALGIPHATISVGGAMGDGKPIGEVFAEADKALYLAKNKGRNRSAVQNPAGEPVVVGAGDPAATL